MQLGQPQSGFSNWSISSVEQAVTVHISRMLKSAACCLFWLVKWNLAGHFCLHSVSFNQLVDCKDLSLLN